MMSAARARFAKELRRRRKRQAARSATGHPFRTRALKLGEPADRERKFIYHVERLCKKRRPGEFTAGRRYIAIQEFRRGSSAHVALHCIKPPTHSTGARS